MKDIRVVQAKVLLKFSSVAPVRGFSPPAVVVLGDKLNLAEEVIFNGIEAPEFYVVSPGRMLVRIPDSQIGKRLDDLQIRTSVQLAQQDAAVSLGLGKPVRTVSGIDRLVQEFVLVFYTTPGSDLFNPNGGGGALAVIGKAVAGGANAAASELAIAVDRTRNQISSAQAKNPRIPAAEKLLSCGLSSVQYDKRNTSLTAVIDIKNMLGSSALVTVG